ncbi:ORF6N domain-containing protein [Pedobacter psychrodurus]|uniref:ORF6N domain-containing protein n=1 Tax=Pedobacter psychrodurus TaxID=2530456 RepID=UPI00292F1A71|nr:ORF6N domain-containing protein [Pedobacter psychrodurus]
MQIIKSIQNRIYEIRGERVMLDFDLASLYEVETKVLNQAVKRNIKRFPDDFMFQLTSAEFESIKFQIEAINQGASSQIVIKNQPNLKSQIVTSSWGGTRKLPYAFTEQGVAMLSGVVNSDKAINMNIAIMRAFVDVRKILLKQSNLNEQLTEIKERIGEHDVQLNELYDAMENLIDEKIAQIKWNDRERIGFKIKK